MTYFYSSSLKHSNGSSSISTVLFTVFLSMFVAIGLSACGSKEKTAGQALVRVNGEEITILQLNDELRRAGMKSGTSEEDNKKLLESMIDRQLLIEEGVNINIDRTPEVLQSIQRAKAQIIADAYLEYIIGKINPPTQDEIDQYYQAHPAYFAQRKQFDMDQLIVPTKDLNEEFMKYISNAKTLNEVAAWLGKHNVHYVRGQLSRNSADLTEVVVAKLEVMKKGQLFIVNQGDNTLISALTNTKDSPVTAQDAAPQIKQYLINSKSKEAVAAEIARLRSLAKIEYLNAPPRTAH